jgi:hypothetical protein
MVLPVRGPLHNHCKTKEEAHRRCDASESGRHNVAQGKLISTKASLAACLGDGYCFIRRHKCPLNGWRTRKPLIRKTRGVDAVYTEQLGCSRIDRGCGERRPNAFFVRGTLTRSFVGVITGI